MKIQYEKKPVLVSFIMIFLYLFVEHITAIIGSYVEGKGFLLAGVQAAISTILLLCLTGSDLGMQLGLCRPRKPARFFLYYIPLALLTGQNLWAGFAIPDNSVIILFFAIQMFSAAIIEEVLFRGFLLHALLPYGKKNAILRSSLVFGLIHLLNLTGGMQWDYVILQVLCAGVIGVLYGVLTCKSGSLLPAILAHGMNNSLSIIGERPNEPVIYGGILLLGTVLYIWFLVKNDWNHMRGRAASERKY